MRNSQRIQISIHSSYKPTRVIIRSLVRIDDTGSSPRSRKTLAGVPGRLPGRPRNTRIPCIPSSRAKFARSLRRPPGPDSGAPAPAAHALPGAAGIPASRPGRVTPRAESRAVPKIFRKPLDIPRVQVYNQFVTVVMTRPREHFLTSSCSSLINQSQTLRNT